MTGLRAETLIKAWLTDMDGVLAHEDQATLLLIRVQLELSIVLLTSGLDVLQSLRSYARMLVMRQLHDYVQWSIRITGDSASNVQVRVFCQFDQ